MSIVGVAFDGVAIVASIAEFDERASFTRGLAFLLVAVLAFLFCGCLGFFLLVALLAFLWLAILESLAGKLRWLSWKTKTMAGRKIVAVRENFVAVLENSDCGCPGKLEKLEERLWLSWKTAEKLLS